MSVLGLVFAALPAVLVRFTIIFYAAYASMPPPTVLGPPVWDHSYYALIWHTWHWQPIVYQLRLVPARGRELARPRDVQGRTAARHQGARRTAFRVLVAPRPATSATQRSRSSDS